ncbi:MAG: hypothetical protein K8R77_16155, partial [Anaerolineaceae bacterium]|nr:hypothetical protein [Anaerolineaceae bacterium]
PSAHIFPFALTGKGEFFLLSILGYNVRMPPFLRILFIALLFLSTITACAQIDPPISAAPAETAWLYEDLLLLDPVDVSDPDSPDIFALYYHPAEEGWAQFRLDLLEKGLDSQSIYLALDTNPGGTKQLPREFGKTKYKWDILISLHIAESGWQAEAYQSLDHPIDDLSVIVENNPESHSLIISFPADYLSPNPSQTIVQAIAGDQDTIVDLTTAVPLDTPPPSKAPLLLAFWDILPSNTIAQILQRWDGAHTGPYGARHGLTRLLTHAEENNIPLALLDFKQPGSLSGLSLLQQTNRIQQMEQQGLLILPDVGATDPALSLQAAGMSRTLSLAFGFGPSLAAYAAFSPLYPAEYTLFFADLSDHTHTFSSEGNRFVPLPYSPWQDNTAQQVQQADRDGLTRGTWAVLLQTALSPNEADIRVIGGSLVTSPCADNAIAPNAFRDLASHPWIEVMNLKDLQSMPAIEAAPPFTDSCTDLLCTLPYTATDGLSMEAAQQTILSSLESLPDNNIAEAAWAMAFHLLRPTVSTERRQLQANYWEQLGHLLYAAQWAEKPQATASCDINLDFDGEPECILASQTMLATFEPDNASLVTVFHRSASSVIQWVGPTSQMVVGLSDPLFWNLNAGTHSDPSVIPGSFILTTEEPLTFEPPERVLSHVRFTSTDGSVIKDYSINDESLTVTIETDQPLSTDLVLALNPQQRFQPDWADNYNILSQTADSFCWGAEYGKALCVEWIGRPDAEIHSFKDSLNSLSQPLDPNLVYPPGHFLPLSLATITFSTDHDFTVTINPFPKQ